MSLFYISPFCYPYKRQKANGIVCIHLLPIMQSRGLDEQSPETFLGWEDSVSACNPPASTHSSIPMQGSTPASPSLVTSTCPPRGGPSYGQEHASELSANEQATRVGFVSRTCAWFHRVAAQGLWPARQTTGSQIAASDGDSVREQLRAHYGENTLAIERTPLILFIVREVFAAF